METYLLKEESCTRENLRTSADFDFLNSSFDLSNSKNDSVRKNSALFSINDSNFEVEREKKIRKESNETI